MPAPLRLVTIGLSHFCEKARWGLTLAGIPWVEEAHGPGLHVRAVRAVGGRRTTPVLVTPEGPLCDSTDILRYVDARMPAGRALFGPAEAAALEERFDQNIGPHVRRLVYFHVLPVRGLILPIMQAGIPSWERGLLWLIFPLLRGVMRRAMRIDAAGAARSRTVLEGELDAVDALLADGRPWLAGSSFSAADLTLASLLAPLVGAEGYGFGLPAVEALPSELAAISRRVAARPAGRHVARCYAQARRGWPVDQG